VTTLRLRAALASAGGDQLPQPFVCDDLDAALGLDADVYVGTAVSSPRLREAWWRKMREAGHETYHRHDDAPVSTRLPVLHPWAAAVRLDVGPPVQVLGPQLTGRRLERSRVRGVTSIVAAEVDGCPPAFHPQQVVAARHGSLWIVVVPAPGVEVVTGRALLVPPAELHGGSALAVDVALTLGPDLRGGRGCVAARDAGRRPPRHGVRVARVAR
jgi:hypothetical protein